MIGAARYWRQVQEALERGDTGLAVSCLENAVREDPANLEIYRALGRILRLAGRPDEAATWYRRCLEIAPADAVATMGLVARVLSPGGRFLFDVEKGEGPEPGVHVSGRYTHSLAVLESALLPRGFTFDRVLETVMRTELGTPVAGLSSAVRRGN